MIPGVPYDAEVEWLQNNNRSYIDTGIVLNQATDSMGCKFQPISNSSQYCIFCGTRQGTYYSLNFMGTAVCFDYYSGGYLWHSSASNRTGLHTWECSVNASANTVSFIRDGVTLATKARYTRATTANAWLFFANNEYRALFGRIGEFWITRSGNELIHLIPVRFTNEQGVSEGAMYDRVTHKLFRNAGTGSFIIGPDVATPIMSLHFMCNAGVMTTKDYIQDGLVTMFDGIENVGWGNSDKQSTNWIDLVDGIKVPVNASLAHFTGNSLYFPERSVGLPGDRATPEYRTITFVVERTTWQSRALFQSGNKRRQVLSNVNGGYCQWYFDGNRNPLGSFYLIANNTYANPAGRIDSITAVFGNDSDIYAPTAVWHNSGQVSSTATSYNSNWATGSTCRIGGVANDAGAGTSGNIFNIRLYNRALTAAEIAANYIVDKARFNLP